MQKMSENRTCPDFGHFKQNRTKLDRFLDSQRPDFGLVQFLDVRISDINCKNFDGSSI